MDSPTVTLTGVLALGGKLVAVRGDTIILEPLYITQRDSSVDKPSNARVTSRRDKGQALPDIAIVPLTAGVRLGYYRPPVSKGERLVKWAPLLAAFAGGVAIAVATVSQR
jgi:hypothetical protein